MILLFLLQSESNKLNSSHTKLLYGVYSILISNLKAWENQHKISGEKFNIQITDSTLWERWQELSPTSGAETFLHILYKSISFRLYFAL